MVHDNTLIFDPKKDDGMEVPVTTRPLIYCPIMVEAAN